MRRTVLGVDTDKLADPALRDHLLESFDLADLHGVVKQALHLGAISFDAVKHLVLCHIERRPPRLDLPSIHICHSQKTSAKAYTRVVAHETSLAGATAAASVNDTVWFGYLAECLGVPLLAKVLPLAAIYSLDDLTRSAVQLDLQLNLVRGVIPDYFA